MTTNETKHNRLQNEKLTFLDQDSGNIFCCVVYSICPPLYRIIDALLRLVLPKKWVSSFPAFSWRPILGILLFCFGDVFCFDEVKWVSVNSRFIFAFRWWIPTFTHTCQRTVFTGKYGVVTIQAPWSNSQPSGAETRIDVPGIMCNWIVDVLEKQCQRLCWWWGVCLSTGRRWFYEEEYYRSKLALIYESCRIFWELGSHKTSGNAKWNLREYCIIA